MNLLDQTYELLCSNTMIQLHDSTNELRQNILTHQEENTNFMTIAQNHAEVPINYLDEKFNVLYKQIEELKIQLKHNRNTKNQATTEETNLNIREMREGIPKNNNERVKRDAEQLVQRQDGMINEISQYSSFSLFLINY